VNSDTSRNHQPDRDEPEAGARKVIVGFDGSRASRAAAEWAAGEATLRGAELEVIMTWDWPLAYARTPMLHESDPVGETRKEFEAEVVGLQDNHPDLVITSVFTHGHPVPILVEASKDAELLVVGSRGHGEFVGMILGSVSQHCAAQAHCPVLIYRTPD
jgi:nucleotide-binding universal stress UspA family protein